jgi:hypothetical protein
LIPVASGPKALKFDWGMKLLPLSIDINENFDKIQTVYCAFVVADGQPSFQQAETVSGVAVCRHQSRLAAAGHCHSGNASGIYVKSLLKQRLDWRKDGCNLQ